MVTAELAVAVPGVVLLLALALTTLSTAVDQIRCVDAARIGVRAAVRGESPAAVRDLARRAAPAGSAISVDGSSTVTVTVRAGSTGSRRWLLLPSPYATASAPREAGVGQP